MDCSNPTRADRRWFHLGGRAAGYSHSFIPEGDAEPEGTPLTRGALHEHLPVQDLLHALPGQVEPQARAEHLGLEGGVEPHEGLEENGLVFFRDTDARSGRPPLHKIPLFD